MYGPLTYDQSVENSVANSRDVTQNMLFTAPFLL